MVDRVKYLVNIVIVVLLLATVTIQRDGRVAGRDVATLTQDKEEEISSEESIETTLNDGTRVINSATLAKDIIGFGGPTPVKLYVKGDTIQKVEIGANSETPSFLEEVKSRGLLERWCGMSLADAATQHIDAVSGATYSSIAIIANVKSAAQWGANVEAHSTNPFAAISLRDIAGLLVIALGVLLTLTKNKNKRIMNIQLALNVAVLGFWCGAFLSLSTLTTWISNGVNLSLSLVTFAMLCVALVMPLLGKKGSYCHLHCPMGSAQELLGRLPVARFKLSASVNKGLNNLRYYILAVLLLVMWLGVGFDLMNYEVFSAFIFSSASTVVLIMAAVFLVLSLFIPRPYCRFVCPTGALITMSQKTKA